MKKLSFVGKPTLRIDALGKATGMAQFSGDLSMPEMLHMKILFAMRPHAKVLEINFDEAISTPGVVAIYTAKDIPVNEYGLQKNDQPVLCGPDSSRPDGDRVRFIGDQVAVIVAESEEIASQARQLIKIEYEDLPILTDPVEAMKPGAQIIHHELGDTNICVHDKIRKGDIDLGFSRSDIIVEDEYRVPVQEHAYLQPEAGLAYIDEEGRITILAGGQWTQTDQDQISHALNLPAEKIRIIYPAIGGAFGGREDISVQIALALATWKLQRPVKIIWSRKESIIGHGKRHSMILKAKWGANKAGKIMAASSEIIADAGAYMYTSNKVLGNSTITATGPYSIPNVKTDVYGVYTNNVPGAAFRGFGAPQALFMAEMQMDKLAEKLGMDPVEFRRINALRKGDTLSVGTPVPGPVSILQVIDSAAQKFHWQSNQVKPDLSHLGNAIGNILVKGKGFACGFKNVGFSFGYKENCWARIELKGSTEIEEVTLWHGSAEVGQGTHTVMVQMTAEATGVPVEKIKLVASDTASSNSSGSVSASRMTFMSGNAIKGAAGLALKKWNDEIRPASAEYVFYAPDTTPFDKETGFSTPNFAYAYVAQAVEVELDNETGVLRLIRVVSANDVGQAINPTLVEGQIEGAVVQAQGYTIQENYQAKNGYVLTDQLSTYLIPTVLDIPESIESVIVEVPDPIGPWGARGLGELPFLPLAPAITAALHDATGIWFNEFPLTPERILRGLGKI